MSETSAVGPVIYDLFGLLSSEEEDAAFHTFFGHNAEHVQDHEETVLFEEWLLFDWRDADGEPLLARGVDERSFTRDQRERCLQLMNNVYSYWQVVDVMSGYSVTLEDVYTDKQYRIRHPRYSRELLIDSTFCARLALVSDRWMPASGFIEPQVLHFGQNNRSDFFDKRPRELSPRTLLWERHERISCCRVNPTVFRPCQLTAPSSRYRRRLQKPTSVTSYRPKRLSNGYVWT